MRDIDLVYQENATLQLVGDEDNEYGGVISSLNFNLDSVVTEGEDAYNIIVEIIDLNMPPSVPELWKVMESGVNMYQKIDECFLLEMWVKYE